MIIEKITVNNFRVFSGIHEISLIPQEDNNHSKPVILFGGLNGSGKTSILTAVRLTIFGKRAFGSNLSKIEYAQVLKEHSHTSETVLVSDDTFIEVCFQYVKQGQKTKFRVRRHWSTQSGQEDITIYENGFALSELSNEQAQSFLFDLIPIGVADLFFFDGEKIKELAEEQDNQILADALKKMVGIDFIERAIADLSVILSSKKKNMLSKEDEDVIDKTDELIQHLDAEIEEIEEKIGQYKDQLQIDSAELGRLNDRFREEGGDWYNSRDILISQQAELEASKKMLESNCHQVFKSQFPFALAPKFMRKLFAEIEQTRQRTDAIVFNEFLVEKSSLLKGTLSDEQLINVVETLKSKVCESKLDFVTPTVMNKVATLQRNYVKDSNALVNQLNQLEVVDEQLDDLGKNLARVPAQDTLKNHFDSVTKQEIKLVTIKQSLSILQDQMKNKVHEVIKATHVLERLLQRADSDAQKDNMIDIAESTMNGLNNLSNSLLKQKVIEIQKFFKESFQRMSRKEDMKFNVEINPDDFSVTLISDGGLKIDKKRLSSGEKQIYALAILEALGKASGRRLPFIIDTPLGRLDSEHRSKIVNEFFPKVNEQVIILSTDTEVDEAFFADLEPAISRSYEIVYDSESGSSNVVEGYFWRNES